MLWSELSAPDHTIIFLSEFLPVKEDFLHRLQHKGYQNKTVGLIENGSWAPLANKVMKDMLTPMKNITICENTVTIKSTYKDENQEAINQLVEEICH